MNLPFEMLPLDKVQYESNMFLHMVTVPSTGIAYQKHFIVLHLN